MNVGRIPEGEDQRVEDRKVDRQLAPPAPDAEIRALLGDIFTRYGYDLRDYAPASMRRRVLAVLARSGLKTLEDLRRKVTDDPIFFAGIVEHLTVRVSEMFRDPSFYLALRTRVMPLLRTYPLLSVWHCGCASGEEVYSMAILLTEEGLYDRAQIYATDLSAAALEQARQGVYSAERLPLFRASYEQAGGQGDLDRYFTAAYDRIAIRDSLRRNILFFQHDLVCDQVFGEMHLVFCRNVLIYFNHELRQRVLQKLSRSVCSAGFLCLGSAERLSRRPHDQVVGASDGIAFSELASEERIYRQCR